MSTLLKAYLVNTDNPFYLFKCYMEERESILKEYEEDKWMKRRDAARKKRGWKPPKGDVPLDISEWDKETLGSPLSLHYPFEQLSEKEKEEIPESIDELPNEGYAGYSKKEWEAAVKEGKPPYGDGNQPKKVGTRRGIEGTDPVWEYPNPKARIFWLKVMSHPEGEDGGEKETDLDSLVQSILCAKVVANPRQLKDIYEELKDMRGEIKSYSSVVPKKDKVGPWSPDPKASKDEKLELIDIFDTKLRLPAGIDDPFNARIRGANLAKFQQALKLLKEGIDKMPEEDKGLAKRIESKANAWLSAITKLIGTEGKRIQSVSRAGTKVSGKAREGLPKGWEKLTTPVKGAFNRSLAFLKNLESLIDIKPSKNIRVRRGEKMRFIYTNPKVKNTVRKLSGKEGVKILSLLKDILSKRKVMKDLVLGETKIKTYDEENKEIYHTWLDETKPKEEGAGPLGTVRQGKRLIRDSWEGIADKLKNDRSTKQVGSKIKAIQNDLKREVVIQDITNEPKIGEYKIKLMALLESLVNQETKVKPLSNRRIEREAKTKQTRYTEQDKEDGNIPEGKRVGDIKIEIIADKINPLLDKIEKLKKRAKKLGRPEDREKVEAEIEELEKEVKKIKDAAKENVSIHDVLRERLKELRQKREKIGTGMKVKDPFPKEAPSVKIPSKKESKEQSKKVSERPTEDYLPPPEEVANVKRGRYPKEEKE